MQRGLTGYYIPLPPDPALELDVEIQELIEKAMLALGRLDGLTAVLPDPTLFLYSYVRKEAVLSSQIEGTQSSLSDLLLFEMEGLWTQADDSGRPPESDAGFAGPQERSDLEGIAGGDRTEMLLAGDQCRVGEDGAD